VGTSWAVAVFLAAATVLVVVAAVFLHNTQERQRADLRDRYADRTVVASALLDSLFQVAYSGQVDDLSQGLRDARIPASRLDARVSAGNAEWAAVVDSDGNLLGASSEAPRAVLQRLVGQPFVRAALRPGGLLYVDEYMGPSRSEWTDSMWGFARSAFDALPEELKNRPELAIPLPMDDPSESVRSSAILPACRRLFEVLEDRPYGGNVLWFVFPCLDVARVREDATGALSRLIALEDHLLERGWVESYFRVLVGRRTGDR
jgi:hypothetical protein